jgi:hypothetical protein
VFSFPVFISYSSLVRYNHNGRDAAFSKGCPWAFAIIFYCLVTPPNYTQGRCLAQTVSNPASQPARQYDSNQLQTHMRIVTTLHYVTQLAIDINRWQCNLLSKYFWSKVRALRDFWLPPRSRWELRSFFENYVSYSGYSLPPFRHNQSAPSSGVKNVGLENLTDRLCRDLFTKLPLHCVIYRKSADPLV